MESVQYKRTKFGKQMITGFLVNNNAHNDVGMFEF